MSNCHVCGSERLIAINFSARMVSSDIQEASGSPRFLRCARCGTLQKEVTPEWRDQAARIYATYHDGEEPSAALRDRFKLMLHNLSFVPEMGRLLEIGCGAGHFLKAFAAEHPGWKLSGAEWSSKWRARLQAIPRFEDFYDTPLYGRGYDVIAMAHVLEHMPDPVAFLRRCTRSLSPGGHLLVVVPNYQQNPADLVVADHCTHFDCASLVTVAARAGLRVDSITGGKEIFALLSPDELMAFDLLEATRREAVAVGPDGIMGSAIAACWLYGELNSANFFVDEDRSRIGQMLSGLPILTPEEVPSGSVVFIPMSATVAEGIISRWRHLPIDFRYTRGNKV